MIEHLSGLPRDASTMLDVGCGDGAVGAAMMERCGGLTVTGIEVQEFPETQIPIRLYDGTRIPFPDASFDIVTATDVLHHTADMRVILREMARVSRKWVIIKDHTVYGLPSRLWISAIDFVTNVPFGIPCEYNYPTLDEWHAHFEAVGLRIASQEFLDIGPGSRFHPIFKLEVA